MKKRTDVGRGNVKEKRNRAVKLLRDTEPETFTTYSLAKIFEVSHVRILQILKNEATKELSTG